jgi:hypothetical protein
MEHIAHSPGYEVKRIYFKLHEHLPDSENTKIRPERDVLDLLTKP